MSTAQKTKSTFDDTVVMSDASSTVRSAAAVGTGPDSVQRPATASLYALPADEGDAATAAISNHGCSARRETNRCPTMPVAPSTPALSFFDMPIHCTEVVSAHTL